MWNLPLVDREEGFAPYFAGPGLADAYLIDMPMKSCCLVLIPIEYFGSDGINSFSLHVYLLGDGILSRSFLGLKWYFRRPIEKRGIPSVKCRSIILVWYSLGDGRSSMG